MTDQTDLPPADALEALPANWGVDLRPAGCARCGQAHLVPADRLGQPCPNCVSGALEPQPARMRPEPPELYLPFRLQPADLPAILTRYLQGLWLRPDDLNPQTLARRATPVFWPMWLVDGDVAGEWQAEAGYDYQVESSQEMYTGAGWQTRKQVETRVRWEPRLGQLRRHYDNVRAPALSGHERMQALTGAYPLDQAQACEASRLANAAVRVPDLAPESAWPLAEAGLARAAGEECQQAAAAQHIRNFSLRAEYPRLNWTQLLLPVYTTYYTDDSGQRRVICINGHTGAAGGPRLASQRKGWLWAGALAAVAVVIFIAALACFAAGILFPPLAALGALAALLAFATGVLAIIPAVWPWQWNRRQPAERGR